MVTTPRSEPGKSRKIYVASSWRNLLQPGIVAMLRGVGHQVYDFKNPSPEDPGFDWKEIDGDYKNWTASQFRNALYSPQASRGYNNDITAMRWADTCVMVLPCGKSAHIEAGYFAGVGKDLYILSIEHTMVPELMYRLATKILISIDEMFDVLGNGV